MQTRTKIGLAVGGALMAGNVAWGKVVYDDAVAGRHDDRNSLVNIGAWVGTVGLSAATTVAWHTNHRSMPALMGASMLVTANAFIGAWAAEKGWDESGRAYCNYGFCNNVAGREHDAGAVYLWGPNPLEDVASTRP